MASKVTFALLVALFLLQDAFSQVLSDDEVADNPNEIAQSPSEFSHNPSGIARGPVTDKVKESLSQLNEIVQKAIDEAINKLQGLNLSSALDPFTAQLKEVVKKAIITITELTQQATEIGVDLTTCALGSLEDINRFAVDTARELASCGIDKVEAAFAIIEDAIAQVNRMGDKVADLAEEAKSCRLNVICYTQVSAKIAAAMAEFPLRISRQVAQAVELITSLRADLTVCAVEKVGAAVLKIEGIVKKVSACLM